MSPRLPAFFVSHGAPDLALAENAYTRALAAFGARFRPRAVLLVSAHWEERQPVRVTGSRRVTIFHDFSGFPRELYDLRYPAPGAPELSAGCVCREGASRRDRGTCQAIVKGNRGGDRRDIEKVTL